MAESVEPLKRRRTVKEEEAAAETPGPKAAKAKTPKTRPIAPPPLAPLTPLTPPRSEPKPLDPSRLVDIDRRNKYFDSFAAAGALVLGLHPLTHADCGDCAAHTRDEQKE